MKIIKDDNLLNYYVQRYNIHQIFESNMKPYMDIARYERGEDIIVSGDKLNYFYLIVEGKAKIFKELENGKSVLIRFSRPLSELGSLELLFDERIADCSVQSLYSTTVLRIPFDILLQKTHDDLSFHRYIIKRLSHKLETTSKTASLNTSYPFKNRFASYLISLTRVNEIKRIDEINFDKLTDLATFLGTSYRHLNRVIDAFEKEGIIKKEQKYFIILDYHKLEELSGGYYE